MDIISHGLWSGALLGRKNKKDFFLAFGLSVLPVVFAEGVMFSLVYLGADNMPSLEGSHPSITEFPLYAQNFYNATHSLIIFALVFLIFWLIRRKPVWILLAWALHILIDIPTHSFALFPTPFLWPVSDFKIDGVSWRNMIILIPNIFILVSVYLFWFYKNKRKKYEL